MQMGNVQEELIPTKRGGQINPKMSTHVAAAFIQVLSMLYTWWIPFTRLGNVGSPSPEWVTLF